MIQITKLNFYLFHKHICSHIYSGTLSTENSESFVDVLIASDELGLLEIYQQFEKHLLENESAWKLPKDFVTLCQFRQVDRFTSLYQAVIDLVCNNPKIIFDSKEFLEMEEDCLIQFLKRDNLKLEEIEIWDYLIKWGIKNTDSISNENLINWTSKDFNELEKTLHNCIPFIRFSQMFPELFDRIRKQYKRILPKDLVNDILQYFSNPNSKPLLKNLPLRESVYPIDSKIINAKDVAVIASWIDKKKGIPYHLKDIPIRFELIYRASQDMLHGFHRFHNFHKHCDNKGPTVVVVKVRNSGEIIGGYNPLDWRSDHKYKASDSFIFSLFSLRNGLNPVLSRVSSKREAIVWCKDKGPCFGFQDLWVRGNFSKSKRSSYKKKLINSETFETEDYEVFQIIDERPLPIKHTEKTFREMVEEKFPFITYSRLIILVSIFEYLSIFVINVYERYI
jgi:hypothetical protein